MSVVSKSHWSDRAGQPYAWHGSFSADGHAQFSNRFGAEPLGEFVGEVGEGAWKRVVAGIEVAKFGSLETTWHADNVSDADWITISVWRGGYVRTFEDYACAGPAELVALERLLQAMTGDIDWQPVVPPPP